ncbi:sorbitol dehydrogenase-like [Agrilus planipennis]|uniref:Sorbitol dehydrogenase n=1 Tax=Agrilus planipennis TaxID=224129 RepID=A0A1W4WUG9_AGRPL|nr:sorbitol dehydrogenase-like [Agrilus planipennis]
MTLENRGLILYGAYDLKVVKLPVPKPGPDEALLEMGCVGICGSDLTVWKRFGMGGNKTVHPKLLGHEPAGTVIEVGSNVTALKKGDRVAVEPIIPCSQCEFCKIGSYNHCEKVTFSGVHPKDGALQKYYVHRASSLHKLPDGVTLEEGALLQPLSIAIHAVKRGGVIGNSKVLIMGAGTIGLSVLLSAKAYGASKVIIADVIESRLRKAEEMGADFTYKVEDGEDEQTTVRNILKIFNEKPTISFECAGEESCVRVALKATKDAGVVVIVGLGTPEYTLPIFDAQVREIDIRGSYRLCNDYPTALELVLNKKIAIAPLVTHRFAIDDYQKAFELANTRQDNCIKVMFHV